MYKLLNNVKHQRKQPPSNKVRELSVSIEKWKIISSIFYYVLLSILN